MSTDKSVVISIRGLPLGHNKVTLDGNPREFDPNAVSALLYENNDIHALFSARVISVPQFDPTKGIERYYVKIHIKNGQHVLEAQVEIADHVENPEINMDITEQVKQYFSQFNAELTLAHPNNQPLASDKPDVQESDYT